MAPFANDPIMSGRLMQSFRHLECQNPSIRLYRQKKDGGIIPEEQEEQEDKEEQEEDKTSGRRHPKLVRQSRVKESMSPRTIRCHLYDSDIIKMKLNTQNSLFLSNSIGCCW